MGEIRLSSLQGLAVEIYLIAGCELLFYEKILAYSEMAFERAGKDSKRIYDNRDEVNDAHGCERFRQRFRWNNTQADR